MFDQKILSMKPIIFCFLGIILLFTACFNDEPIYFRSKFYPVVKIENNQQYVFRKGAHFHQSTPITIILDSRIDYKNENWEGKFDLVKQETALLKFDRDIILSNETIPKYFNLLETNHAEIETIMGTLNGNPIPKLYIIWINKNLEIDYEFNKGYHTIYFKARTEHNNIINDSTIVYIGS